MGTRRRHTFRAKVRKKMAEKRDWVWRGREGGATHERKGGRRKDK